MKSVPIFLFLLLSVSFQISFAQRVSNVFTEQKDHKIYIYYDLISEDRSESFKIEAYCNIQNGKDEFLLRTVSGDVGKGIKGGKGKMIVWDVLKDVSALEGEGITFVVRAESQEESIVSNIPEKKESASTQVEMVYVEGGSFKMGSRKGKGNEQPEHQVYVDDFHMSKYEITNAQYADFLNDIGWESTRGYLDIRSGDSQIRERDRYFYVKDGYENYPVTTVSWAGAQAYCKWIGGRLPTEAEWEYAARGGRYSENYRYSGGDNYKEVGWSERNARSRLQPIGQKQPNELGIFDMSGNLWEWVYDVYDKDYYRKSPSDNPTGPSNDGHRVLRGGSYGVDSWYMRPSYRSRLNPEAKTKELGCRCAR